MRPFSRPGPKVLQACGPSSGRPWGRRRGMGAGGLGLSAWEVFLSDWILREILGFSRLSVQPFPSGFLRQGEQAKKD